MVGDGTTLNPNGIHLLINNLLYMHVYIYIYINIRTEKEWGVVREGNEHIKKNIIIY